MKLSSNDDNISKHGLAADWGDTLSGAIVLRVPAQLKLLLVAKL